MGKFYEEVCLLDQPFIKDQAQTSSRSSRRRSASSARTSPSAALRASKLAQPIGPSPPGQDCSGGEQGIGLDSTSAAHRARATARALLFACNARSAEWSNPTPAISGYNQPTARKESIPCSTSTNIPVWGDHEANTLEQARSAPAALTILR